MVIRHGIPTISRRQLHERLSELEATHGPFLSCVTAEGLERDALLRRVPWCGFTAPEVP